MTRDDDGIEKGRREFSRVGKERIRVAQPDTSEDWPLLSALLGGLALALLVNTFIGLIAG
jgi:hypothetical protein